MGKILKFRLIAAGAALLSCATAANARSQETLVLIPTSGADLAFVPPAVEAQPSPADEAIQEFRRVLGQDALLQRQQVQARCRAAQPQTGTREQRFAWAANCQYARR